MLEYNKSYLSWFITSGFGIIIGVISLHLLHLDRFVLFVPVIILLIIHLIQRRSGIAFDKYWKARIHSKYDVKGYKDMMGKQVLIIFIGVVIAVIACLDGGSSIKK